MPAHPLDSGGCAGAPIGKDVILLKKQSDFSRLMGYAGRYRVFTYASWVLSAISALSALVPFLYIWMILRDVLAVAPDYAQAVNIPHYGWMAVLFAVLSYLIYIAALMCSHLSAFRVATNLRLAVSEHLAVLPLGFAEPFGSGKLRKIIHESTGAAETYLAHQLPDQYNAIATPVGLLVLLLAFDWRLGLLSLAPVVLAFLIMATMTGKRMAEKMRQYGNALEAMSNEAVEYVRGIPVVKTFGQSVFSFKKFKATIDEYEKWVISYTKDLRLPMMFYTAAVNGVFAFLIAGGLLFTTHGVTPEFLLNLLFYIIITPVISLTLTRIMYMSENKMVVADALARIDSVLEAAPMQVQAVPQHPKDSSVTLRDVHFSYDGKTFRFYFNDELVGEKTVDKKRTPGKGKLEIAPISSNSLRNGIQKLYIANRAIVPAETANVPASFSWTAPKPKRLSIDVQKVIREAGPDEKYLRHFAFQAERGLKK